MNQCISSCNNLIINKNRYYLCEQCGEKPEFNYTYDKCVATCPEDKPYIDMDLNKCVDICPDTKRYYVSNYIHSGESDINKKCLNDCPKEYQYYIEKKIINLDGNNNNTYYECQSTCNIYVPNEDDKIIAKLCLNSCPDPRYGDEYKYKLGKKCYKECPNEAPYHFPCNGISCIDGDNQCYDSLII